jgi:parallel beta-helix repeat protein
LKKLIFGIFLTLILCSTLVFTGFVEARGKRRTWIVSQDGTGDFVAIQPALDAAQSRDTVYVKAGVYYEHLTIAKTLKLQGENRETTVIDAGGVDPGSVVIVAADKVVISGFTIQNARSGGNAIWIEFYNQITITDNIISDNGDGIRILSSHGHTIKDNVLTNNPYTALGFDWTYGNTVIGNTISNNYIGVGASYDASDNVFSGNVVSENSYGFLIAMSNSKFYHNNIIDNGVQASVYYNLANTWDNGHSSGGNYWSDYAGTDDYRGKAQNKGKADGIGDTPYAIDAQNIDSYPLMQPFA